MNTPLDQLSGQKATADYYQLITQAKDQEKKISSPAPCDQIIKGLFLGSITALQQRVSPDPEPEAFETIISVCPLEALEQELRQYFVARQIHWMYLGEQVSDQPSFWKPLVYNCTYLDDQQRRTALPSGMRESYRREEINETNIEKWFDPVFQAFDKAVFEGKKTLIHCRAGISRSPAVVAAYLINRFGVTSQQALTFLRQRRFCIDPCFKKELDQYAQHLFVERHYSAMEMTQKH